MSVPGLAGVDVGSASGMSIALLRGPGGLTADNGRADERPSDRCSRM
jgi:hypothetical protein